MREDTKSSKTENYTKKERNIWDWEHETCSTTCQIANTSNDLSKTSP